MKHILSTALAVALMSGTAAMAQTDSRNNSDQSESRNQKDKKAEDKKVEDKKAEDKKSEDAKVQVQRDQAPAAQRQDNTAQQDRRGNNRDNAGDKTPVKTEPTRTEPVKTTPVQMKPDRRNPNRDVPPVQTNPVLPTPPVDRNAQDQRNNPDNRNAQDQKNNTDNRNAADNRNNNSRWSKGDRIPEQYRRDQYVVSDWQQRGLRQPPRGYHWVRNDHNDYYLAAVLSGLITMVILADDRDNNWRDHYSRHYTYDDDGYYRDCRNSPDPAGILAGAFIGGLIGNAVSHNDRSGSTFAGVIIGAGIGAALTSNLDCEDRSYAYRSYYDGFNSGRTNHHYRWTNSHNNHRGDFLVRSYFNDPYGFRCARFTQVTYIQGRQYQARGVACRQPDGAWAVVN